jgi:hypothetical protein
LTVLAPKTGRRLWPVLLAAVLLGVFAMAASSTRWFTTFGGKLEGERLERARRSPRFDGQKFVNPVPTNLLTPGTTWEMIRHQVFGREQRVPPRPPPVVARITSDYATPPTSGLRATWIGHASTLVERARRGGAGRRHRTRREHRRPASRAVGGAGRAAAPGRVVAVITIPSPPRRPSPRPP